MFHFPRILNEDNAIRRAKALRKNNETSSGDWKVRPSTNFDELIKAMKDFISERQITS